MFCPNCGKEQEDNAKFCRSCGAKLVLEPAVQPVIPPAAQPAAPPGAAYAPAVEYAGFWRRFGAMLIDGILVGIVGTILALIIGIVLFASGGDEASIFGVAYLTYYIVSIIFGWLYYTMMESSHKQATLGKQALGIIVTDDAGRRISFGKANARYFSKIVSGMILYVGFLMVAWTQKKQGLHDMMAGTLVVLK